jgi:hypothetical protein
MSGFLDPGGICVSHGTAIPLYLENCVFYGAPVPAQLRLGYDPNYPLNCVVINLVTDNPTPFFNVGPHLNLTVWGAYVLNGSGLLDASAPIATYSQYVANPLVLGKSLKMGGPLQPAHLADSAAPNDSEYFSTTQNKMVYKDSSGTVNPYY